MYAWQSHHSRTHAYLFEDYKLVLMCAVAPPKSWRRHAAIWIARYVTHQCGMFSSNFTRAHWVVGKTAWESDFDSWIMKQSTNDRRVSYTPDTGLPIEEHTISFNEMDHLKKCILCSRICLSYACRSMNGISNFSFMNGQFTNFRFHLQDILAERTQMASTFSMLFVAKHEPDGWYPNSKCDEGRNKRAE